MGRGSFRLGYGEGRSSNLGDQQILMFKVR